MITTETFEIWRKVGKKAHKVDEVTTEVDWTPRKFPMPGRINAIMFVGKMWVEDNTETYAGCCITRYEFDTDAKRITYSWSESCPNGGCRNCF